MERLEKFNDPCLIPLPPSPPPRIRIPSRRPHGWVSTVANPDQNHSSDAEAGVQLQDGSDQRSVRSQQTALGHGRPASSTPPAIRPSASSRRVSSTMQYAMMAQSRSASRVASVARKASLAQTDNSDRNISAPIPNTPALTETRSLSDPTGAASVPHTPHPDRNGSAAWGDSVLIRDQTTHAPDEYVEPVEVPLPVSRPTSPDIESLTLERPKRLDEVLEERRADEEWMGYVRAQLGALFPDFVAEEGGASAAENNSETSVVARGDPGQVVASAQQAGRELINNVPSVRLEINELRDEIERLRSVVGGIATGLSATEHSSTGSANTRSHPDEEEDADRAAVEGLLEKSDASPYENKLGTQHLELLTDIIRSLSLIFPAQTQTHDQLSLPHLSHLKASLRDHLTG